MRKIILPLLLCLCTICLFGQKNTSFYIRGEISAKFIYIDNHKKVKISFSNTANTQLIELDEPLNEKHIHFKTEDYNFDGFKDFSYAHIDDGQGVCTMYRIFLYNPKQYCFEELVLPPQDYYMCGFSDIKINKKAKQLECNCRAGYWYKETWIFNKLGKLQLLKSEKVM